MPPTNPATSVRAVLDTNILMDMLHFHDGRAVRLKAAIDAGRVHCFSDAACLAELERVAAYPEFGLSPAGRDDLIAACRAILEVCDEAAAKVDDGTDDALPRCRDADDQKFLELTARCRADVLVTRDRQLLRLARHRLKPPPFAILTAEDAVRTFLPQD